jgi:hypothetical protein
MIRLMLKAAPANPLFGGTYIEKCGDRGRLANMRGSTAGRTDPIGKKHYRLRTHHLRSLVQYVEQGGILEIHDNIPDRVREQLYAEERQRFLNRINLPAASRLARRFRK